MDLNSRKGRFGVVGALLLAAGIGGYVGSRWQALQDERTYRNIHSLDQVEVNVNRVADQVTAGPSVDVTVRNGDNVFYLNDVTRFAQQVDSEVRTNKNVRSDERAMLSPVENARRALENQNPQGTFVHASLDYGVHDGYALQDKTHVFAYHATFKLQPQWP